LKNTSYTAATVSIAIMFSACKTTSDIREMPDGDYRSSVNNVPYAAGTPLRDLNITAPKTNSKLAALQNPYGTDTYNNCQELLEETRDIEAALIANQKKSPGTMHTSTTKAGNAGNTADVATKTLATSIIPFRSVVRYVSGASKRDLEILHADQRGRERLGFLIGVGSANNCSGFNSSQKRLY